MKQKTPTVLSFARAATEGRLARGSTMTRSKRAGAGLDLVTSGIQPSPPSSCFSATSCCSDMAM